LAQLDADYEKEAGELKTVLIDKLLNILGGDELPAGI
jgi:hypothetical protein